MSMSPNNGGNGMMSEINVTPLVDVMLVLLTVFIVTTPLLMNAVNVKLPKAAATTTLSKIKSIRLSITLDGNLFMDQTPVMTGKLESALRARKNQEDFSVEILADEKVPYGEVARVMAQVQRAGISKFSFVMLPERE